MPKLFSSRAIGLATYLGGPLAAGVLIRQNFIILNKQREGAYSLVLGLLATVALFWGLMYVPEEVIDKIPNPLIPAFYTIIVLGLVSVFQGKDLKKIQDEEGKFQSIWKALLIGLVSAGISFGVFYGALQMSEEEWDYKAYNKVLAEYHENEQEALKLYDILETAPEGQVRSFIRNKALPKWEEGLEVLKQLRTIENVPSEFKVQAEMLIEYTELQIESYQLINKALKEGTDKYDNEMAAINQRIDYILTNL